MERWTGAIVGGDVDDAVEKVAHVALATFCSDTQIELFPIRDQEEREWRQSLEAACELASL
jgi:hypothetical protein